MSRNQVLFFVAAGLFAAILATASCSSNNTFTPPDASTTGGPDAGSSCASTCAGCCAANGYCFTDGTSTQSCGLNGAACQVCTGSQICSNGRCTNPSQPDSGSSCTTGCLDSSNNCQAGTSNGNCGSGGNACNVCASTQTCVNQACAACTGCVDGTGVCQAGTSTSACGASGAGCQSCSAGQTCTGGSCQGGTCNGCVNGSGCQTGNTNGACGTGGANCAVCSGTNTCVANACAACAGCIDGSGVCQAGNTSGACGKSGGTCTTCTSPQTCNAGVCSGGGNHIQTVFLIMMENHDWSQVNTASYISSLIGSSPPVSNVAWLTNYTCPGPHPSLPNYLWLEAGTNFGITADGLPSAYGQTTTSHLVTLLQNANVSWKSFQECVSGTDCPLNTESSCSDGSSYAPKHDPMVFFSDVTNSFSSTSANCISHVRPMTDLLNCSGSSCTFNASNVARYNFITPDLCNDMHDCSVATGDAWLAKAVPAIYGWSGFASSAIFIIWDEGANSGNGPIGNIIISPFAKPGANSSSFTHSSTLRTMQDIFGVTPYLGGAASATNLSAAFNQFP